MSLIFPTSPSNGDEYQGYVYDSTDNVWNRLPNNPEFVRFSETAPSNPQEGTLWFNTTVGKMFVYYNDGSSSQWVSAVGGIVGQTGTEGQMLIHDGTEWVAYDGGSRNLLYNGAMQVAQRGTSSTGITTSGYYTADRWNLFLTGLGTWTQTVEADGPTGSGFTKSLKMECTTADSSPAAGDALTVQQRLEGQDLQGLKKGTSAAESVTLSFWVKSNVTGTYIVELYDAINTRQVSASYTISSSGTWEKKTLTYAGDTTGTWTNSNVGAVYLNWFLGSGTDRAGGTLNTSWAAVTDANRAAGQVNVAASTSNYWQVTGVQLETGTVATPFEHKSYATELVECQRYYYVLANGNSNVMGVGALYTAASVFTSIFFPTKMRVVPSLISTSGTDYYAFFRAGAGDYFNSISMSAQGTNGCWLSNSSEISGTAGHGGIMRTNNTNSYIAFDSEL